jgi:hypothetical protein
MPEEDPEARLKYVVLLEIPTKRRDGVLCGLFSALRKMAFA